MNLAYKDTFWAGLKPDPKLSVSQWADSHRVLSSRSSAEPGFWRTSRTPYAKEIMDCLSVDSIIQKVVFQKGAQVGATEIGNNWIGYIIDHAPGPTLAVSPTVELAKRNSKQRIAPLIEECPRLASKVKSPRSRDSGNTVMVKEFPGGILVLTGANSAVGLRSVPAKNVFGDEIDAYPGDVDGEGDPIKLMQARQRTFSKRKLFLASTPTIEGRSRIQLEFDQSDQRYYFLPCPHCNHMQHLIWAQIKWPTDDPLSAKYECENCEELIENWQKTKMLEAGKWIATNPECKNKKVAGFHLNSLYSPVGWASWGELAVEFVEAKNNREQLRTFVNTVLGETWKDKGEAPDWKRLWERREKYKINSIPDPVLFLTAGADIQKDRIEVEIVGWGRNKRSWSIDYRVYMGDTSHLSGEPWQRLAEMLTEVWDKNGIELGIKLLAIDSGYNTQTVYSFVRQYTVNKVIAIKGQDGLPVMIGAPRGVDVNKQGKKLRKGLKLFNLGVGVIKGELYGFLKIPSPGPDDPEPHGFCRFPEYGEDYFKMLTAEELQVKIVKGFKRFEWVKVRERNEALDCRVYARAAASIIGMDRFKDQHWRIMESQLGVVSQDPTEKNPESTGQSENKLENTPQKVTIVRRKSKFM